ncbi:MAG: hypothetical protein FWF84_04555, partial [Kiritimatiellaeota bacterium]|nr:hypothetical protein [Kiritimatiellota bacterium]
MNTIPNRLQLILVFALIGLLCAGFWGLWTRTARSVHAANKEALDALATSELAKASAQDLGDAITLHAETLGALAGAWDTAIAENAFIFPPHDTRLEGCQHDDERIGHIYRLLEEALLERRARGDIHAITRTTPRPVIAYAAPRSRETLFTEIPLQADLTMAPDAIATLFDTPRDPDSILLLRSLR